MKCYDVCVVQIVQEYERAVIFRLGRILRGGAKGPGTYTVHQHYQCPNKADAVDAAALGPSRNRPTATDEKRSLLYFGCDFYRAMLCIRGTSHGPVSVSVSVCLCLSQVGVLLKRLNVGSHKEHHTITQGI